MRLTLPPGGDIAAIVGAADPASSLVLVVEPSSDALWRAMARAAIGPLAIARAPASRLNAVFAAEDAADSDIDAAVAFLDSARSTTGQIIDVRGRPVG